MGDQLIREQVRNILYARLPQASWHSTDHCPSLQREAHQAL